MKKSKIAIVVFLLSLSGCTYPPLMDEAELPDDYTYQIGPGDSIEIFVWGYPEISTTATVRPDGKITTPLIDDVEAFGRTPSQLAREMEVILGEYVRDPQVAIIVGGFQGVYEQQVRVLQTGASFGGGTGGGFGGGMGGGGMGGGGGGNMGGGGGNMGGGGGGGGGGISSPQAFPYKKGMTLLDLMIEIGGLGMFSDGNKASIIRTVDGEQKHFSVRIDDLMSRGDLTANVKIMPGDILIIPESFF
ncbi:MAG: polysaccharide export protein [Methylicorpusculum sp.]|uniref:polysaccharide export protein n=1 Tax=Methylicorpusculum sp. TaxID=2713644 RepID=UPI002723AD6B|nr:polysaccharide export protein [Methylicorpusculum sp.]MDO8938510.1 polysaccharide export protein [Methylicorpusculum sp.]MDP2202060.1 polysaccharide export protein [Methylicorpusculum sp.]